MKKIFPLLFLALSVSLTSCLNDDPELSNHITLMYSGDQCFNRVTNLETGEVSYTGNPTYKMVFEQVKGKLDMEMSNIQLSSAFSGLSLLMPTIDYTYDGTSGYYLASATNLPSGNSGSSYTFSNFSLRMIPNRYIQNSQGQTLNCPVYLIDYTLNDTYKIMVFPTNPVLVGMSSAVETPVTEGEAPSGTPYVNKDLYVNMLVDPGKMTTSIGVNNVRFEDDMLHTSLVLKDLPVTITAGGYSVTVPGTIPVYNTSGNLTNNSSVKDLTLNVDIRTGVSSLSATFIIYGRTGDGDETESYDVDMTLGYFYMTDDDDKAAGDK